MNNGNSNNGNGSNNGNINENNSQSDITRYSLPEEMRLANVAFAEVHAEEGSSNPDEASELSNDLLALKEAEQIIIERNEAARERFDPESREYHSLLLEQNIASAKLLHEGLKMIEESGFITSTQISSEVLDNTHKDLCGLREGSILDLYADVSTEPADYTGGDD